MNFPKPIEAQVICRGSCVREVAQARGRKPRWRYSPFTGFHALNHDCWLPIASSSPGDGNCAGGLVYQSPAAARASSLISSVFMAKLIAPNAAPVTGNLQD